MTETRLLAAYNFGACVSAMNVRSLVSTMRRVGEQKGVGSMFVIVQARRQVGRWGGSGNNEGGTN